MSRMYRIAISISRAGIAVLTLNKNRIQLTAIYFNEDHPASGAKIPVG